jgi:hypothetical protein
VDRLAIEKPGRLELLVKGVYADRIVKSRWVTKMSVAPESDVNVIDGR